MYRIVVIIFRKGGSAPKGGAHSTVCFACTASETLESCFCLQKLLMAIHPKSGSWEPDFWERRPFL